MPRLFDFLTAVNSAVMNLDVHFFSSVVHGFRFFRGIIPKSCVAVSSGSVTLAYQRNLHIDFHSGHRNFQSHQQ